MKDIKEHIRLGGKLKRICKRCGEPILNRMPNALYHLKCVRANQRDLSRKYMKENRERSREYQRKYRIKNRDRINECQRRNRVKRNEKAKNI